MRQITSIVQQSATQAHEAAFGSVESALRFAFGNSGGGLPDSLGKWMPSSSRRDPIFETKEERAAWAGDIKRRIELLPRANAAILVVKFAPRASPCSCRRPCCSGWARSQMWIDALEFLVDRSAEVLTARGNNRVLRTGAVKRWALGETGDYARLATQAGVSRQTASKHAKEIRSWLEATLYRAIEDAHAALS